jgi:hypothetical protein
VSLTPTAPPLPPAGDLPRVLYLLRVLWLCFFPVFTVVAGNLVLLLVPQAREALQARHGAGLLEVQDAWLVLAHLFWIGMAWYTARLLLDRRFSPDTTGLCAHPGFSQGLTVWLPRALVLLGGLPIALLLAFSPGMHLVGGLLTLLTLLFFRGVVMRRQWLAQLGRSTRLPPMARMLNGWQTALDQRRSAQPADARTVAMAPHTGWFVGLWAVSSLALLIAILQGMEAVARPLGAPALLLMALASWTLCGGLALTYWPKSMGRPALTWLPALAFLLSFPLNDNHPVARRGSVPNAPLPALNEAFTAWLQQRPEPTAPVLFVASAGGASRAAYWASSSLGLLEDEARRGGKRFAGDIFLISGISGGSLGAATFVATLDATPPADPSIRRQGNCFTGLDHLSTVLGFMLYPDLVQRLLPWPIERFDRSRGLEEVWARDWQADWPADRGQDCGHAARQGNPWTEPFTALHARSQPHAVLPLLSLSTTALQQAKQVFQADFKMPGTTGVNLLAEPQLAVERLTLAEAVHNSARFPYVSPAGRVLTGLSAAAPGAVWDRLGDGGYVEASAALPVLQTLRALREAGLVRDCQKTPAACADGTPGRAWIDSRQVRVLLLENSPSAAGSWRCATLDSADQGQDAVVPHPMPMPDLLAPLLGLMQGRSGRSEEARHALIGAAGGCQQVAELYLPHTPTARAPSMNWMLNADSRTQIDTDLDGSAAQPTPAHCLLGHHLNRVRGWIGVAARPPQGCRAGAAQ